MNKHDMLSKFQFPFTVPNLKEIETVDINKTETFQSLALK